MPKKSAEHSMLKQCSSIDARKSAEQCPTNATYVLTKIFGLLEHSSYVSNARRGAEEIGPIRMGNTRTADAARGLGGHGGAK